MRFTQHSVKIPSYTRTEYGEEVPTYSTPQSVYMFLAWVNRAELQNENTLYSQYDFVALTKTEVPVGALIDNEYEVGAIDKSGRYIRLFISKAYGKRND